MAKFKNQKFEIYTTFGTFNCTLKQTINKIKYIEMSHNGFLIIVSNTGGWEYNKRETDDGRKTHIGYSSQYDPTTGKYKQKPYYYDTYNTSDYNIRISMNGPQYMTFETFSSVNDAIHKAKVILEGEETNDSKS